MLQRRLSIGDALSIAELSHNQLSKQFGNLNLIAFSSNEKYPAYGLRATYACGASKILKIYAGSDIDSYQRDTYFYGLVSSARLTANKIAESYLNNKASFLLLERICGNTQPKLYRNRNISEALHVWKQLCSISFDVRTAKYRTSIHQHISLLQKRVFHLRRTGFRFDLTGQTFSSLKSRRHVICHNDLHIENIISSCGIYVIDFSHSMISDPMVDVGGIISHYLPNSAIESWVAYRLSGLSETDLRLAWFFAFCRSIRRLHHLSDTHNNTEIKRQLSNSQLFLKHIKRYT